MFGKKSTIAATKNTVDGTTPAAGILLIGLLTLSAVNYTFAQQNDRKTIENEVVETIAANKDGDEKNATRTEVSTADNQLSALNNLPPIPTAITTRATNNLNGGYFNSFGGLLQQKYLTYLVGVKITLPIGNRQAKADLGSSLAEGTKLDYQLAQQKQTVESEIRNALESVNATEQRWKLAVQTRELAQTLYDSERRQNIAGTSTTYLVLERQTTLVQSQAAEVQAQTDLNKAISNLRKAVGTSLDANNVNIQNDNRQSRRKGLEIFTI